MFNAIVTWLSDDADVDMMLDMSSYNSRLAVGMVGSCGSVKWRWNFASRHSMVQKKACRFHARVVMVLISTRLKCLHLPSVVMP